MGSQYAGWRISVGKYFGMGSGPARALGLKPKELYEEIGYKDDSELAVRSWNHLNFLQKK